MHFCQEVKNKEEWEKFLLGCQEKTFLQSWNWGDFYEKMGNKVWRFGLYHKGGGLSSVFLVIKLEARRGKFLLLQHCLSMSEDLLKKLKELARQEGCSFIRVVPLLAKSKENEQLFRAFGFRESPMHASAYEATLKLDIGSSKEQLLANMRKTTRYLIHQALKNPEIEIVRSDKTRDIELYQKLNERVAGYQKFTPFSLKFVKNEFEVFSKDNQILLFFAKYKGEVIASALVVFWSGIGFYHQAALHPKYHKVPAAYLLQWEAIKEAKNRGCKMYDFWGYVDHKAQPDHPWAGPTLFKIGFGGKVYEYIKTQDLPLSKKYWPIWAFEKIRSKKRGL
jgi:lipid II:glycine glycyltransferase (peptidoglycan interpeptide bridge formation enzyme)